MSMIFQKMFAKPLRGSTAIAAFLLACAAPAPAEQPADPAHPYFRIQAIDQATGRGIPMVRLQTTNQIVYFTDSAGIAAVDEPGLMGTGVWLSVSSPGYEFAADGFGMRGLRVALDPGGRQTLKLKRVSIAQRLYRVTGQGIYRDSALLGDKLPLKSSLLNAQVMGQDSVRTAVYHGRLYWFWGDTLRASYPLGHFGTSGAVSALPGAGGLDPAVGVDLEYLAGSDGFSRPVFDTSRRGPMWMGSAMTWTEGGRQVLAAHYMRVEGVGKTLEQGIAVWNDERGAFDRKAQWPLDAAPQPAGHPLVLRHSDGGEWFYFCNPFPLVRVRTAMSQVLDPQAYECYTCLKPGARKDGEIERDDAGHPLWSWKRDTALAQHRPNGLDVVDPAGAYSAPDEFYLTDIESGKKVLLQAGSIHYNDFRHKWIMLANQILGDSSMLGEVWYAQADTPLGPWAYARKVATHGGYSFYNAVHHPEFDQDGGRLVYFEGTYTTTFAGNLTPTPRYEYNQLMYGLDLSDPRLELPVPVYQYKDEAGNPRLGAADQMALPRDARVAFFAMARDVQGMGLSPLVEARNAAGQWVLNVAQSMQPASPETVFYALPAHMSSKDPNAAPLDAYTDVNSRTRIYATDPPAAAGPWRRDDQPLCVVWRAPNSNLARLPGVTPVRAVW